MKETIHRAKYILPEPGLLFKNGAIHIDCLGRICGVGIWEKSLSCSPEQTVDWGSAIIMPGLINAHAHLELTLLQNQLTQFGSFTDWISTDCPASIMDQ